MVGGGGYVKNINRTNNADVSLFFFLSFFLFEIENEKHSADKIYVFVGGWWKCVNCWSILDAL